VSRKKCECVTPPRQSCVALHVGANREEGFRRASAAHRRPSPQAGTAAGAEDRRRDSRLRASNLQRYRTGPSSPRRHFASPLQKIAAAPFTQMVRAYSAGSGRGTAERGPRSVVRSSASRRQVFEGKALLQAAREQP